jgi:DNA invertase Pin-like site-specific DNA recombinase
VPACLVPCVIYAAKSTEDRRGSIPDQLRECHEAIERADGRYFVADYVDEAVSGYRRSRGAGLAEAMEHAEDLARENELCELWAQHSDRLARGDGRSARHTVEIALWALKRDVRVRTVQDPDTFRDLLYAVVVGQRNHEDSRRKGLAVGAGRRRAAERGDYLGYVPDGYRLHVEVDPRGEVKKSMVIDPDRRAVIEMIFRLALRGRTSGAIARAVNKAGWLTNPTVKGRVPQAWTVQRVLGVLRNGRYAGLSTWNGEILARGSWPAYITERQLMRIAAALARRRRAARDREFEAYLLVRLATCGRCGSPLHANTRHERVDGSSRRNYVCVSHHKGCHAERCDAFPVRAEVIEALFVSAIPTLLLDGSQREQDLLADEEGQDAASSPLDCERRRLIDAVAAGEGPTIDATLERLFTHMSPADAVARAASISQRRARRLEEARAFQAWAEHQRHGSSAASRSEARKLNRLLRTWFTKVTVEMDEASVEITAQRRAGAGEFAPVPVAVRFDRCEQARLSDRPHRKHTPWADAEIVGALQAWAARHGRSPAWSEWRKADPYHPGSLTVARRYGSWSAALRRAGLKAPEPAVSWRHLPWSDEEIVTALRLWSAEHGQLPAWPDWLRAATGHPSTQTVRAHFGSWQAGLAAAAVT